MENQNLFIGGLIDVETTGLDPAMEEVIELAILLFALDRNTGQAIEIIDEYVGLREPSKTIDERVSKIHGISDEQVRGKQLDRARVVSMIEQADFLIAHNANFDRSFLKGLFEVAATKEWYCTMQGINWKEEGFASRGLQKLLQEHGIEVAKAHRAKDDAKATLDLLTKTDKNGETYLKKLLQKGPYHTKEASFKK